MIAAGHPRLTFELSAFLANMPHHWDDRDEKARDDYAAHVWAVGQIASTEAALRSAGGPGQGGRSAPAANGPAGRSFPNTIATPAIMDLSLDSYRQKIKKAGEPAKLGRYAWGTWYLPMTRLLLEKGPARTGDAGKRRSGGGLDG